MNSEMYVLLFNIRIIFLYLAQQDKLTYDNELKKTVQKYFRENEMQNFKRLICLLTILFFSFLGTSCAQFFHPTVTRPIPVNNLAHYSAYPNKTKKIILRASYLSDQHLGYRFGSANPHNGAMDCSGVIYYILKNLNYHVFVPRDSYEMYFWLMHHHAIHYVTDENFYSPQFNALKPGDLLFWTGTFRTNRKPPITHVMLYLGKNKNGQRLMFGSSDGGLYRGEEIYGVSVFDFILPGKYDHERFVAYGCIPHFTC